MRTHEDLFQSYWENIKKDKYVSEEELRDAISELKQVPLDSITRDQLLDLVLNKVGIVDEKISTECIVCGLMIIYENGKATCKNNHKHADGKYNYLCGSDYCRCCQ